MADKKISALTAATTPLAGTEVLPIVQSGSTVKVANNDLRPKQIQSNATSGVLQVVGPAAAATRVMTVPDANFTAARTDAAQSFTGDQTLSTGNLIQGTAAKGVNFTANTGAAGKTSQLLNWYEEGTWTPSVGGNATYTAQSGYYTRIGNFVKLRFHLTINVLGTGSTTNISGMPFTPSSNDPSIVGGVVCYANNLAVAALSLGIYAQSDGLIRFFTRDTSSTGATTQYPAVIGNGFDVYAEISYQI